MSGEGSAAHWPPAGPAKLGRCWRIAVCGLLGACLMGCESLQRKFTRAPKAHSRLSPVTAFQDYTHALTPLDRYRKHYVMFDYWNAELLAALQARGASAAPGAAAGVSVKRLQKASGESLNELQVLHGLLQPAAAAHVDDLLKARVTLHDTLRRGSAPLGDLEAVRRELEQQTQRVHRELYWRNVEDLLEADQTDARAD